ncbi:unnamed protein product [Notodromas monacha]|uniref:Uncharacterized protein n=1 Tax=Notodromas monacha TaxID=399045 RepID=A0A7R9GHE6_9CRUS|nr:unnamed protein product [Notodromas monacha]CAG0922702.1 unnamed protein product [Notodromas monacha]
MVTESASATRSFLFIQNVRQPDSGTYTCKPPYGKIATAKILVLDGERPAAMQQGSASLAQCTWQAFIMWTIALYTWSKLASSSSSSSSSSTPAILSIGDARHRSSCALRKSYAVVR